jgi:choline dehydrogenase-like flavoprotein
VTGAALFPTAGSWNPTLTICGFAQDLARRLHKAPSDQAINLFSEGDAGVDDDNDDDNN